MEKSNKLEEQQQGWSWTVIKNPRKPNGDLGDVICDFCEVSTGAYLVLPNYGGLICKSCLLKGIDFINKIILTDNKRIWFDEI